MRMTHKREFYIPEGAELVDAEGTDAAIYIYDDPRGRPCAVAFHGRAQKPDWRYYFRKPEHRNARIRDFIDARRNYGAYREEMAAKRRQPHTLKVGDILSCSWGYEQTNIDFYQVVALNGKTMVTVREIAQHREHTGDMQGYCTPIRDRFIGAPMRRRASARNSIDIASYSSASPWDGKPEHWTSYH